MIAALISDRKLHTGLSWRDSIIRQDVPQFLLISRIRQARLKVNHSGSHQLLGESKGVRLRRAVMEPAGVHRQRRIGLEARKAGHSVTEQLLADGSITFTSGASELKSGSYKGTGAQVHMKNASGTQLPCGWTLDNDVTGSDGVIHLKGTMDITGTVWECPG